MANKITEFLKADIWRIRLDQLSKGRSIIIKQLRIILLSVRGFSEDECQLKASALTFFTLLSIVPVLAMAFGVAKGFGFEHILETHLLERLPGHEEVITQAIGFAHSLLQKTRGGLMAGIGVGIFFWSIIKVLRNIEKSFNSIWGVKEVRTIGRKFSDYLTLIVVCPALFIIASSVTVYLQTQITQIAERIAFMEFFGPVLFALVKFLPFCVIWILFTFIYVFIPNTKVRLSSGIFAGIAAGTIYQLVQWVYISFQVGAARYGAIYGSFAAVPLFLIWIQLSWIVILLGAEISFAHQNVDTYEFEPDCLNVSNVYKKVFSVRIAELLVKNFIRGEKPLTDIEISKRTDGPIRLVRQIIYDLINTGVLSEVSTDAYKQVAYQPARNVETLKIVDIIDGIEKMGTDNVPIDDSEETRKIICLLRELNANIKDSSDNILLKDI